MTGDRPTLLIFPHAGGSAEYYVPFAQAFTTDVKRVAVQYPGRDGVHDVGAFTGISELAEQVCAMLSPLARAQRGRTALFGHSMGALVAFEVARHFEEIGKPVAGLFVSACAAPGQVGSEYIPQHDRGLLDAVSQMTGADPDFLENEEFAAKILPTLRGLRAIAEYTCPDDAVVSCPIFAFVGDEDEVATLEKVEPWSQRTTGQFSTRVFHGYHFYLNDHLPELVDDIEQKIAATCEA
ncbi:MAG TPA: alpha/beta fold hydrolase [Mycobacterium sp.]|nr:alpha/beta fold hydrolase [Mycobacterium sp.]